MAAEIDGTRVEQVVAAVVGAFAAYHTAFKQITHRAQRRFEQCDWHGLHADGEERLDLYTGVVAQAVAELQQGLGAPAQDAPFWAAVKAQYTAAIAERDDFELAESFYNSAVMRVVGNTAIDPRIEYIGTELHLSPPTQEDAFHITYLKDGTTAALVREVLRDCAFAMPYLDLEQSAAGAAAEIDAYIHGSDRRQQIEAVEIAKSVFYREKGAYLVGRIRTSGQHIPLILALRNTGLGIYVDAVLLTADEVSIIFSFTRSYFHVEVEKPYALIHFLKTILPRKPIAELYISIGYNKHGKTELYRDLIRYLAGSQDRFEIARGERGMVMTVFTLTSYDVVFKIIKDTFDYPKTTTRQQVMNRYQLVFKHDRGGRLVDAQEFEHLRFGKDRFAPELLVELLRVAANTVSVAGDTVVIKHLYTERRLTPLNLYLHEVDARYAEEAVVDYGQAIKDLAATNIFPGDLLLKNFGVTRHGRVVFYDYDELCLLTDCNFRVMPQGGDPDEDMFAEPWFSVGEDDVFPEELTTFLGLPPALRQVFTREHGELFGVPFWAGLQARLCAGEVLDVFPYKESKRLPPPGDPSAQGATAASTSI